MNDHKIPLAFNHIGLSVTDIDAGIAWYSDIFHFTLLEGPFDIQDDGSDDINVARTMLGNDVNHIRVAHMASGNGVGLELFEFINPKTEKRTDNHIDKEWRMGLFHFSITHPDVAWLREKIDMTGGKALTKVMSLREDAPHKLCYCADPFGNVIEIMSTRYEQIFSNRN